MSGKVAFKLFPFVLGREGVFVQIYSTEHQWPDLALFKERELYTLLSRGREAAFSCKDVLSTLNQQSLKGGMVSQRLYFQRAI